MLARTEDTQVSLSVREKLGVRTLSHPFRSALIGSGQRGHFFEFRVFQLR